MSISSRKVIRKKLRLWKNTLNCPKVDAQISKCNQEEYVSELLTISNSIFENAGIRILEGSGVESKEDLERNVCGWQNVNGFASDACRPRAQNGVSYRDARSKSEIAVSGSSSKGNCLLPKRRGSEQMSHLKGSSVQLFDSKFTLNAPHSREMLNRKKQERVMTINKVGYVEDIASTARDMPSERTDYGPPEASVAITAAMSASPFSKNQSFIVKKMESVQKLNLRLPGTNIMHLPLSSNCNEKQNSASATSRFVFL